MSTDWTIWPSDPVWSSSAWDWQPPWVRPSRPGTMRWALQQTVAPTSEPVTLADAKAHLRVDITEDDDLIDSLIVAARDYVERRSGLSLVTQTWKLYLDRWPRAAFEFWPWPAPGSTILLPRHPVQSVTSLQWLDAGGTTNTVAGSDYSLDVASRPARIRPVVGKSWPATSLAPQGGVVVAFVAGFASAALVPATLRQAMLLLIGTWYRSREDEQVDRQIRSIELAKGLDALLGLHMPMLVG